MVDDIKQLCELYDMVSVYKKKDGTYGCSAGVIRYQAERVKGKGHTPEQAVAEALRNAKGE